MRRETYQVDVTTRGRSYRSICGLCGRRGPSRTKRKIAESDARKNGWEPVAIEFLFRGESRQHIDVCKRCVSRILGGDRV